MLVVLVVRALVTGRLHLPLPQPRSPATRLADRLASAEHPGEAVRAHSRELGGGAFLGFSPGGRWVTADPEHAVMLLGPPRSGKTTSVVIPSLLAAPGAALSTSTKRDVIDATWRARSALGQVWLFDPSGEQTTWPPGMRKLCWSPVAAATSWDAALLMARAMASISPPRMAPATSSTGPSAPPRSSHHSSTPRTSPASRSRPSCAGCCAASSTPPAKPSKPTTPRSPATCSSGSPAPTSASAPRSSPPPPASSPPTTPTRTRKAAAKPSFDPDQFARSTDTVYITAPAHKQALAAPLVVGLLEQIRHATYRHATHHQPTTPPVFFCLDEIANIAPIHDLPALVSEAGGQHLHILACLQDLSQARSRWGQDAADGFLSLFQTKLILTGIADTRTLEAISTALGEYDRQLASHTISHSKPDKFFATHTDSESVTHHTQRHRTLNPGDIARLPPGHGLVLHGTHWGLTRLTPWHRTQPWTAAAGDQSAVAKPGNGPGPGQPGSRPAAITDRLSGRGAARS